MHSFYKNCTSLPILQLYNTNKKYFAQTSTHLFGLTWKTHIASEILSFFFMYRPEITKPNHQSESFVPLPKHLSIPFFPPLISTDKRLPLWIQKYENHWLLLWDHFIVTGAHLQFKWSKVNVSNLTEVFIGDLWINDNFKVELQPLKSLSMVSLFC